MNSAEAMGHVAVASSAGLLGLFWGLGGLLVGIILFIAWTISTNKRSIRKAKK